MNCKTIHFSEPCEYNASGITALKLIDFRNVVGSNRTNEGIKELYFRGDVLDIPVNVTTKMTSTETNGIFAHSVTGFLLGLSHELVTDLQTATAKTFVVLFTTAGGKTLAFGLDGGAKLRYKLSTEDNNGAEISIQTASKLPIIGLDYDALGEHEEPTQWRAVYFDDKSTCQIDGTEPTGVQFAEALTQVGLYTGEETGHAKLNTETDPTKYPNYTIDGTFVGGEMVEGYATARINTLVCVVGAIPAVIKEVKFSHFK